MHKNQIILFVLFWVFCAEISEAQDMDFELIVAAEKGDEKKVFELLRLGADVDATIYEGITPLILAAENGHRGVVKALLRYGADVNHQTNDTTTALHAAVWANKAGIVEILLKNGAFINAKDQEGLTPLHYSSAYGYFTVTDMLIFYGARFLTDRENNTPLHLAAYNGNDTIVALLAKKGWPLETKDYMGFTALHCAVAGQHNKAISALIENGANINATLKNDMNALHIAIQNKDDSIAAYLIEQGIDINHKITPSLSTLHFAKLNENKQIVSLLKNKNAKNGILPYFDEISFSFANNFNFTDYTLGGDVGIRDSKFNISFNIGVVTRPFKKRTLHKQSEDLYFQLREKRSVVYAGIEKCFFFSPYQKRTWGVFAGVKQTYSFGRYIGSNKTIEKKWFTVPQIGVIWSTQNFSIKTNYEYIDWHIHKISPHRINVSFMLHFLFRYTPEAYKYIYWL